MSEKLHQGACIVIADGTGATIYENVGPGGTVKLRKLDDLVPRDLADDGPAGKRPPESSQQETDEATFAKQLANHLYHRWTQDRYAHIAIVADPETLGQLRPSLHQEVSSRIVLELAKTLTNSPIGDIERSIENAL